MLVLFSDAELAQQEGKHDCESSHSTDKDTIITMEIVIFVIYG